MAEEVAQLLKQQNQIFAYWAERMGNFQITIPNSSSPAHLTSQSVPLPPPLCLEGDMEENFTFFESNWKNYSVAVGMNDWPDSENKKKVSFLLSVVGTDALKRYFNFELSDQQKATPEAVLDAIRAKVVSVRNIIVDRLEFFSAIQTPTESIDEYVSRLKVLGKPCRFGTLEQDMMVFKIVTSNKWYSLKAKMLTMTDVNLSKAIDLCRMEEITARHSKQLSLEAPVDVNKIVDRVCKFCGGRHPFKRGVCPAFGKRCDKCGGKNHFQRVCKSNGSSSSKPKSGRKVKAVISSSRAERPVDVYDADEEKEIWIQEEEEAIIGKITDNSARGGAVLADLSLKFGNVWKVVSCELDTGARASIIGIDWLKKLSGGAHPELDTSRCRLRAFNGTSIEVLGQIKVSCQHKSKRYRVVFQVVNMSHAPLLSVTVCTTLGLVKFCNAVHRDPVSSPVLDRYREDARAVVKNYRDVFEGYGKMEGAVTLEIDESVKPVIQTPRRIPIAFRDDLRRKIDQLVNDGIIQKESKHTDWNHQTMLCCPHFLETHQWNRVQASSIHQEE
ncbi:uncharacterized protein LOC134209241 [Armigeres subalbatus]|uniref:uncharacterized protein LOC134209241 n=1 Tax=Armigeres subalbatus TaxID=124917 RepID=UPI002ECFF411